MFIQSQNGYRLLNIQRQFSNGIINGYIFIQSAQYNTFSALKRPYPEAVTLLVLNMAT